MKKSRSTSTLERTNIQFPLWRKKVDNSLLRYGETPIPNWAVKNMNLEEAYPSKSCLKKNDFAKTTIFFKKNSYEAYIRTKKPTFRYYLSFTDDLIEILKKTYLMTNMRNIESSLRKNNAGLEDEIPFWEFIDIEFDIQKKHFIFTDHYKQKPVFPELFRNLGGSPQLKSLDDDIHNKKGFRIHKQDWRERNFLDLEIEALNVIYTLLDSKNKLLYVGEAKDLKKRLQQTYPSIPHWTHYRYDVLPKKTSSQVRLAIERMVIRSYASLLVNKSEIPTMNISNYKLANDKIDKA